MADELMELTSGAHGAPGAFVSGGGDAPGAAGTSAVDGSQTNAAGGAGGAGGAGSSGGGAAAAAARDDVDMEGDDSCLPLLTEKVLVETAQQVLPLRRKAAYMRKQTEGMAFPFFDLVVCVNHRGGYDAVVARREWTAVYRASRKNLSAKPRNSSGGFDFRKAYDTYLTPIMEHIKGRYRIPPPNDEQLNRINLEFSEGAPRSRAPSVPKVVSPRAAEGNTASPVSVQAAAAPDVPEADQPSEERTESFCADEPAVSVAAQLADEALQAIRSYRLEALSEDCPDVTAGSLDLMEDAFLQQSSRAQAANQGVRVCVTGSNGNGKSFLLDKMLMVGEPTPALYGRGSRVITPSEHGATTSAVDTEFNDLEAVSYAANLLLSDAEMMFEDKDSDSERAGAASRATGGAGSPSASRVAATTSPARKRAHLRSSQPTDDGEATDAEDDDEGNSLAESEAMDEARACVQPAEGFLPDGTFADSAYRKQQIDALAVYKSFCDDGGAGAAQFEHFLVPSREAGKSLTAKRLRIRRGSTYHIFVRYKCASEVLAGLNEVAQHRAEHERDRTDRAARARFRATKELRSEFLVQPDGVPKEFTATEEHIKPDLLERLGCSFIFRGAGKRVFDDRVWARKKLDEILSQKTAHAIADVVLFAPCNLLPRNVEWMDAPGSGDEDALKQIELEEALAESDVVVHVLHRSLREAANDIDFLYRPMPRLLPRMVPEKCRPHERRVKLVFLRIAEPRSKLSAKALVENWNTSVAGAARAAAESTRNELQVILEDVAGNERAAEIVENTLVETVSPLLFSSLMLNREFFGRNSQLCRKALQYCGAGALIAAFGGTAGGGGATVLHDVERLLAAAIGISDVSGTTGPDATLSNLGFPWEGVRTYAIADSAKSRCAKLVKRRSATRGMVVESLLKHLLDGNDCPAAKLRKLTKLPAFRKKLDDMKKKFADESGSILGKLESKLRSQPAAARSALLRSHRGRNNALPIYSHLRTALESSFVVDKFLVEVGHLVDEAVDMLTSEMAKFLLHELLPHITIDAAAARDSVTAAGGSTALRSSARARQRWERTAKCRYGAILYGLFSGAATDQQARVVLLYRPEAEEGQSAGADVGPDLSSTKPQDWKRARITGFDTTTYRHRVAFSEDQAEETVNFLEEWVRPTTKDSKFEEVEPTKASSAGLGDEPSTMDALYRLLPPDMDAATSATVHRIKSYCVGPFRHAMLAQLKPLRDWCSAKHIQRTCRSRLSSSLQEMLAKLNQRPETRGAGGVDDLWIQLKNHTQELIHDLADEVCADLETGWISRFRQFHKSMASNRTRFGLFKCVMSFAESLDTDATNQTALWERHKAVASVLRNRLVEAHQTCKTLRARVHDKKLRETELQGILHRVHAVRVAVDLLNSNWQPFTAAAAPRAPPVSEATESRASLRELHRFLAADGVAAKATYPGRPARLKGAPGFVIKANELPRTMALYEALTRALTVVDATEADLERRVKAMRALLMERVVHAHHSPDPTRKRDVREELAAIVSKSADELIVQHCTALDGRWLPGDVLVLRAFCDTFGPIEVVTLKGVVTMIPMPNSAGSRRGRNTFKIAWTPRTGAVVMVPEQKKPRVPRPPKAVKRPRDDGETGLDMAVGPPTAMEVAVSSSGSQQPSSLPAADLPATASQVDSSIESTLDV